MAFVTSDSSSSSLIVYDDAQLFPKSSRNPLFRRNTTPGFRIIISLPIQMQIGTGSPITVHVELPGQLTFPTGTGTSISPIVLDLISS